MGRRLLPRFGVSAALALTLGAAPGQASFHTGFFDPVYESPDPAERTIWFDRTVAAGASIVRIMPAWSAIAPGAKSSSFHPADPADPAYHWDGADAAVRDASSRGLSVLFTLNGAPIWAQGSGRPRDAGGAWRPDPAELAAFATAAARRYSGHFPDPAHPGSALPRVRYWQIWNEPNLQTNLAPQWVRTARGYSAASPKIYRSLLNTGYAALKRVDRGNFVVTAGTGPYGDPGPGGRRIQPVDFWRRLLAAKTSFDAFSHHPYAIAGPRRRALNPDDAAIPDLGKISRVLHVAQRAGTVSTGQKPFWVTEISWDSRPPDPFGVPEGKHARWLEEAFWFLWRQGVSTVTWFEVRDQAKGIGYEYGNQSGIYLLDGTPKLAATAFRFPFVVERGRPSAAAWGMSPGGQPVVIERLVKGRWQVTATPAVRSDRTFVSTLRAKRGDRFQARAGAETSLTWTVA